MTEDQRYWFNRGQRKGYRDGLRSDDRGEGQSQVFPCWYCGAKDARDENHQRGCPKLEPVPEAELIRLADVIIKAWEKAQK